jgi:hypothetical protein
MFRSESVLARIDPSSDKVYWGYMSRVPMSLEFQHQVFDSGSTLICEGIGKLSELEMIDGLPARKVVFMQKPASSVFYEQTKNTYTPRPSEQSRSDNDGSFLHTLLLASLNLNRTDFVPVTEFVQYLYGDSVIGDKEWIKLLRPLEHHIKKREGKEDIRLECGARAKVAPVFPIRKCCSPRSGVELVAPTNERVLLPDWFDDVFDVRMTSDHNVLVEATKDELFLRVTYAQC